MIAYYTKRSPGEEFEKLEKPISSDIWVDGNNLTAGEIDEVIKDYNLTSNIVYDVRDRQELPRVEASGEDLYVFIRVPRLAKSGHVATAPMLCVLKSDIFVSLTQYDSFPPEAIAATTLPITTRHADELLLGVIASCVGAYQESIQHTERAINDTASRLRSHEVTNQDFIHFVVVEDNLTAYHVNLGGLLAVIQRLRDNEYKNFKNKNNEALDDIILQIQQLLVAVSSYATRVKSIRDAYSTIANNNLNKRMKTLTVITVLITLPNVIFGMYGMNVALPFEHESWIYGVIVGISVVVIAIVYLIGRRLRVF
jgi:magnesium transporter